ncbi:adhesion G protein-coupled receptor L3-like [Oratosquilla oratoria]|uniref:adhesion G protein-coupled receptor L3-like n=1 Tax=Oratosquilla oratoria TaxID=337810 RepID=UPI003F75EEDB
MRGNASWTCGGDGEWIGLPDMSACKSIDASAWIDELDKSNATAGAILQEFTDNSTTTLAAGDVSEVLNLLDVAAKRHVRDIQNASDSEQSTELSLNYTKGITSTANYMLQEPKVWHGIPNSDRRESVSTLQAIVREAGIESAQQLKNDSQLFTFDALSVKIEQHPSSYYDAVSEEGRTLRHPKFEDATLKLPKGFQGEQEIASVTFMAFNNLHCVLNEKLPCVPDGKEVLGRTFQQQTNSPIMGAAVSNTSWQASPPDKPVVVTFPYIYGANVYNLTNLTCVFWDEEENDWSTEGCDLVTKDQKVVVCECDHLTNLAVIMDLNGVLSEEVLVITGWITVIGCSISIVCLTICVIVFELVKHIGNLSSSKYTIDIHLNLCWCLLIVEITMLAGLDSQDPTGCQCTAVLLHYFFLATFCWCAVEGCNMYLLLVSVFHTFTVSRRHYYLIGYGLPLILVCITAASTSGYGYRTQPFCWLESSNGAVWAFGVPLILILLMNSVILGLGLKAIIARPMKDYRTDSESSRPRDFTSRKSIVLLTLKLVTILGLTWVLGFSYLIAQTEALAIVFTTFNSLQGVFLLVFLVLTNDKIRKEMRRIILRLPPTDPYSSGNQRPTGTGSTGLDSGTFAVQIPQGVRINPRRSNELDYAACKSQLELEDLGRRRTGSRF